MNYYNYTKKILKIMKNSYKYKINSNKSNNRILIIIINKVNNFMNNNFLVKWNKCNKTLIKVKININ